MRARSVDIQVFLSFFLPLALALVHAAVGMTAANAVIAEVGKVDAAASSAVAAVLLLVIYGGYFLADYAGDKYAAEARFQEALSTLNTLGVYGCTTRIGTWMEVMGTKVLVLFIGLYLGVVFLLASAADRKSTRLNSSHLKLSRMPSSA